MKHRTITYAALATLSHLATGCGKPVSSPVGALIEIATAPDSPPILDSVPTLHADTPGAVRARFGAAGTRHLDRINAVAYAPDGATIASVSHDGTLRFTPREGGAPRVAKVRGIAWAVAFTPDGARVVAGMNGGALVTVDVATGEVARTTELLPRVQGAGVVHARGAAAAFVLPGNRPRPGQRSPDHPYAGSLVMFDLARGRELWKLPGVEAVGLADFSVGGRFALASAATGGLRAFDMVEQEELPQASLPRVDFGAVTITADGDRLFYSDGKRGVRAWDRAARADGPVLPQSRLFVEGLRLSPDERWLAGVVKSPDGYGTGELRIWDLSRDTLAHSLPLASTFEPGIAFSPDNEEVAVGDGPHLVRFSLVTGSPLDTAPSHDGNPKLLVVDPTGTRVATATDSRGPYVWEVATGKHLWGPAENSTRLEGLAFAPDGRHLVATAPNGPVFFEVGKTAGVEGPRYEALLPEKKEEWSTPRPRGVGFVRDGEVWLDLTESTGFSPSDQIAHRIHVRAGGDWARLGKLEAPPTARTEGFGIVQGRASGDGSRVAVLTSKWDLEIRAAGSEEPLVSAKIGLVKGPAHPAAILWSEDANRLFTPLRDGRVVLWDTATLKPTHILAGHEGQVVAAAEAGERIVTLGQDGLGLVWDLAPAP